MEQVTKVLNLAQGFMHTQIIYIFSKYGYADFLKDGPKLGEELAGLAKTQVEQTTRLLRAAAAIGIVSRDPTSLLYSLNDVSSLLVDGPASMKWLILHWAEKPTVDAWLQLDQSMVDGSYAFKEIHGMNCFEYYGKNPQSSDRFNKAMTSFSITAPVPKALVSQYGFENVKHLVDIGGNQGAISIELLAQYPHLKATIFDLPHVIEDSEKNFTRKEFESRINFVGGSFFESVPADGDLYMLKFILHDWEDSKSIEILKVVRNSMPANAKILLVEHIVQETGDIRTSLLDLHMMALNNAKERTEKEFVELFNKSGLQLTRVVPLPAVGLFAIEASKK